MPSKGLDPVVRPSAGRKTPAARAKTELSGFLRRRRHHGAGGPGGRSQAAGHVHRLDRRTRSAPPRLRGRRQLGRRGARRPLRLDRDHAAPRQQRHGCRQRPRHPGRHAQEGEAAGGRGRADGAARRRQVRRRRRLQGVRRPARRRRLGRQRAVGAPRPRDPPRRPRLDADLRARRAEGPAGARARPRRRPAPTITFLPDAEIFVDERVLDFETLAQRMRETAFLTQGPAHQADRRARLGRRRSSSSTTAASATSSPT